MATFVASLETQREAAPAKRAAPRQARGSAALLVSALTLFAVAIDGYHPFADDGGLYVAGVKRLLDPQLYPHATEFVLEPLRLSLFAPTVAEIVRLSHLGLPAVLLGLHLATIWATLFAAWLLAERCWTVRPARTGAVVLLACWLALPVAGTALALMDPYLTARSFSTPCMVLALVGALDMTEPNGIAKRRGLALWATSLAIATAMHPLMAAYALGATLLLACLRAENRNARVWGTVTLCALAIALAASLQAAARPETAAYIHVAMTRTYWFPAEWRWYELAGLIAPLAILAVLARAAATRSGALTRMALAAGATAYLIALLFARATAATHLLARLQPLRAFHIVYLVMVLALGAKLGEYLLQRRAWRWAAAMLLLGGIMFAAQRSTFPNSSHIELPGTSSPNPWVQAFQWIRVNTPKNALFALDTDYINAPHEDAQCFRAIAERSALPDYSKDGGEASIAPELTAAWQTGQAAQQNLSEESDSARLAALHPLGVTWAVMKAGAATNFDCPYRNSTVQVCRLP